MTSFHTSCEAHCSNTCDERGSAEMSNSPLARFKSNSHRPRRGWLALAWNCLGCLASVAALTGTHASSPSQSRQHRGLQSCSFQRSSCSSATPQVTGQVPMHSLLSSSAHSLPHTSCPAQVLLLPPNYLFCPSVTLPHSSKVLAGI